MALDWAAAEDAIRAWVKAASGLADSQVIWAEQTAERPALPFITIRLGDLIPLGAVDEQRYTTDLGQPAGQEVAEEVKGQREFPVSIQAYTQPVTGNSSGRTLLSRVQTALGLSSVRQAFTAAGISVFDAGQVRNISELVGTRFEGRALLECRFYGREDTAERMGYIAECEPDSYLGPPDLGTEDEIDI